MRTRHRQTAYLQRAAVKHAAYAFGGHRLRAIQQYRLEATTYQSIGHHVACPRDIAGRPRASSSAHQGSSSRGAVAVWVAGPCGSVPWLSRRHIRVHDRGCRRLRAQRARLLRPRRSCRVRTIALDPGMVCARGPCGARHGCVPGGYVCARRPVSSLCRSPHSVCWYLPPLKVLCCAADTPGDGLSVTPQRHQRRVKLRAAVHCGRHGNRHHFVTVDYRTFGSTLDRNMKSRFFDFRCPAMSFSGVDCAADAHSCDALSMALCRCRSLKPSTATR